MALKTGICATRPHSRRSARQGVCLFRATHWHRRQFENSHDHCTSNRLIVRMGRRHRLSMPSLTLTYPAILAVGALAIFLLTRIVLTVVSARDVDVGLLPSLFAQGLWFDVVTLGALLAPFWLANALIADGVRCSPPFAWSSRAVIWIFLTVLLIFRHWRIPFLGRVFDALQLHRCRLSGLHPGSARQHFPILSR